MRGFPDASHLKAMSRVLKHWTSILALSGLGACATRSVELISYPSGAEVQTMGGETLGTTPIILKGEALEKGMSADALFAVRFVGPGLMPQTLIVEVRGSDTYKMTLAKLDEFFFQKYIQRDFSNQHNAMTREILNVQGLIRNRKLEEAEKVLHAFQDRYPTIAVGYVMRANLALLRGDKVLARRFLSQAQDLDPLDPVVGRMLGTKSIRESQGKDTLIDNFTPQTPATSSVVGGGPSTSTPAPTPAPASESPPELAVPETEAPSPLLAPSPEPSPNPSEGGGT